MNEKQAFIKRSVPKRRDLRRSPLRLSPSSIAIFQQCPQQYKFRYIDKLGEQYTKAKPYYTMANHVHATLKDLVSTVPLELRNVATAKRLLLENWEHSRLGFRSADDERRWLEKALSQVKAFALSPYLEASPIMLEAAVEAEVSPGVMLYGRVDRVDQEQHDAIHIIDYKTGKVPPQTNWMQLRLHALTLSIMSSRIVSKVSFLYLEPCKMITQGISPVDLDETRWELLAIASRIRQERQHIPRPGAWCRGCDFGEICSAQVPKEAASNSSLQLELWEELPDDV